MSESTVDRHVYMFLNRTVYTAYNLTDPEAIKVEYTHTHIFTKQQITQLYKNKFLLKAVKSEQEDSTKNVNNVNITTFSSA